MALSSLLKVGRVSCFIFIITLLFQSCQKLEAVFEDTTFYIENDILAHPVTLQFLDANRESGMSPLDVTIKYIGPDADQLFTADGRLNPKPSNGLLDLFIVRSNQIAEDNPLDFTIIASARGYEDLIKTFSLRDTIFHLEKLSMINLAAPPNGVAREATSSHAERMEKEGRVINTDDIEQVEQTLNITLNKGTKIFDENNQQVSGRVDIKLIQYDTRNPESMSAFPGNLESNTVITAEGTILNNQKFTTAGFYSLDMTAGQKEVKSFSDPLEVTLELEDNLFNPSTGEMTKLGDRIPVWSLDEEDMTWQYEDTAAVIEGENGQLVAQFEMAHLSYWNLAWIDNNCQSYVTIQSDLLSADSTAALNTFLVHVVVVTKDQNGQDKESFQKGFLQDLSNGTEITFINTAIDPALQDFKFRIFEGTGCNPNALVYETQGFELLCDQSTTLNLSGVLPARSPSNAITTTVDVSGYCRYDGRESDVVIRPTLRIFFREAGCNADFNELGEIKNGEGVFQGIEKGKTYDFLISIPEDSRILYDITIPLSSGSVDIPDFDEDVQFTYLSDTEVLMEYLNVRIPDDICAAWEDFFGE